MTLYKIYIIIYIFYINSRNFYPHKCVGDSKCDYIYLFKKHLIRLINEQLQPYLIITHQLIYQTLGDEALSETTKGNN